MNHHHLRMVVVGEERTGEKLMIKIIWKNDSINMVCGPNGSRSIGSLITGQLQNVLVLVIESRNLRVMGLSFSLSGYVLSGRKCLAPLLHEEYWLVSCTGMC